MDQQAVIGKLGRILKKANIANAFIGWNKDIDISKITSFLKDSGTAIYLWLPVFSELDALAGFLPIVGHEKKELKINYDMGNGETFRFCCPAHEGNVEAIIKTFEKHYSKISCDGVFLDKIRFPSFIGGLDTVLGCFCDYCRSAYDLPGPEDLRITDNTNPLGIISYRDLRYEMNGAYKKLFDYKCDAVYNSLERLCVYFRERGLKINLDLFAPFLAYFVGQDYHRLTRLADSIKPMFYGKTNAPAGLPFEINMYSTAFDNDPANAEKRKKVFLDCISYENNFINSELTGIKSIIHNNALKTKLYAGIELNYNEDIAPVTEEYIRESAARAGESDGIVMSWDLSTTPDSHIDCFLDTVGG